MNDPSTGDRAFWRQGDKFRPRSRPVNPASRAVPCARGLAARGNTQFHKWRLSRGPRAPRARPLPAQPHLGPRTPGPGFGAKAAARRETAVARHSCPLPLRLPFMLRSSCSRREPRSVPFGPSRGWTSTRSRIL